MADFAIAIKVVLQHEGNFINNIHDSGGITNMGITARTLASYLKAPVSVDQMKALTIEQASHIYETAFWDELNLDSIQSQALATIIMDLAVVMGPSTIVKMIQEILHLTEDGILGSHTVASINQFTDPKWLAIELICEAQNRFSEICYRDEPQIQFLTGWLHRSHDLIKIIFNS